MDGNDVGTGFTYVDQSGSGGYLSANLNVDTGTGLLDLTTTAGLNSGNGGSLDNALGVGIGAPSQVTRIETTLSDPPAGTGNSVTETVPALRARRGARSSASG